jgi:hypothetical protein
MYALLLKFYLHRKYSVSSNCEKEGRDLHRWARLTSGGWAVGLVDQGADIPLLSLMSSTFDFTCEQILIYTSTVKVWQRFNRLLNFVHEPSSLPLLWHFIQLLYGILLSNTKCGKGIENAFT